MTIPPDHLELSIVIPVYNEAEILADSVRELLRGIEKSALATDFEVILAENGSRDATTTIATGLAREYPQVRVLSCPTPNYGAALRMGLESARGTWLICEEIDLCDHDFHAHALRLLRAGGVDVVVGSKAMPGAHDRRPWQRRVATRVYNQVLRWVLGFRGTDTHGLKAMRRAAVLPVVAQCVVGHDVFASELVIRCERAGLRVQEVPVALAERRAPSVGLLRRVPKVLGNVARLAVALHCDRGDTA